MCAKPAGRQLNCLGVTVLLACLLIGVAQTARAAETSPLRPADTSSPRATIQSFMTTGDDIYRRMKEVLAEYRDSDRLYLNPVERQKQAGIFRTVPKAIRALDVSGISPVLVDAVAAERVLQLKEILDRIEIPPFADIPDREAMARTAAKRWRLPETEIDFVLVEHGPRAGEYLVSAETVERLPEFYERVKGLAYKPGPAQELSDLYQTLSSGKTDTIYEAYSSSPVGLGYIVPPRWMLHLPDWARIRIAGVTAWQWLGLSVGVVVGALVVLAGYRLARRVANRGEAERGASWHLLPLPLAIILVTAILLPVWCTIFRISGGPRVVIEIILNCTSARRGYR
jgi:MscS family membrane protein